MKKMKMLSKIFLLFLIIFSFWLNNSYADNLKCESVNQDIWKYSDKKILIDDLYDKFSKNKSDIQLSIYKKIDKLVNDNLKKINKVKYEEKYIMLSYLYCKNKEKIEWNFTNYILKDTTNWIKFYQTNSWDLSILDIDLNSAKVSFAWVHINEGYFFEFRKFDRFKNNELLGSIWNDFLQNKNIYALVNGQFFDPQYDPTWLSFSLKSDWNIINAFTDTPVSKRTFIIDNDNNAQILEWYNDSFLNEDYYKELIVGFSPKIKARSSFSIWRTYIWIKDSKNIVFFIAGNKTQTEMDRIIFDYGIKQENVIMMDWGSSSQFSYNIEAISWRDWKHFYWTARVPHYFVIYNN